MRALALLLICVATPVAAQNTMGNVTNNSGIVTQGQNGNNVIVGRRRPPEGSAEYNRYSPVSGLIPLCQSGTVMNIRLVGKDLEVEGGHVCTVREPVTIKIDASSCSVSDGVVTSAVNIVCSSQR